jgi:hypothetical protein
MPGKKPIIIREVRDGIGGQGPTPPGHRLRKRQRGKPWRWPLMLRSMATTLLLTCWKATTKPLAT